MTDPNRRDPNAMANPPICMLTTLNAVILVLYTLSTGLFAWVMEPGYGITNHLYVMAGIYAIYSALALMFVVQRRTRGRLITIACWMNGLPLLLTLLFLFMQGTVTTIFAFIWDGLGDHAMLIIFSLFLLTSLLGTILSMVLFVIGFARAPRKC